jgi:hypothetical protein
MFVSLISSICFFNLSGTKAYPSVHPLILLRSFYFSLSAMLSSNISTSGASIISSIRPFSSEWSR